MQLNRIGDPHICFQCGEKYPDSGLDMFRAYHKPDATNHAACTVAYHCAFCANNLVSGYGVPSLQPLAPYSLWSPHSFDHAYKLFTAHEVLCTLNAKLHPT